MTDPSVCDQLYDEQIMHNFPNSLLAVDIHLARHAACNVIGWRKAAPPKSHKGSGAVRKRQRSGGDSVGGGNSTPFDGCN